MQGYDDASYGDGFADVYDEWYQDVTDVEATVEAITRLAGGGRALELGVGTGRIALPLAARGVEVHGVDSSERMLDRLRAKPGAAVVSVTVGDMAADLPSGPFQVVFVTYNTFFNLRTADAQRRCFHEVAARLAPGGVFVIEAFVPTDTGPGPRHDVGVRSMHRDAVVLSVSVTDPATQTAEGQYVELSERGGVRLRPWSIRYATPSELDEMATAAGLRLAARHADWHGSPFDADAAHHVSHWCHSA